MTTVITIVRQPLSNKALEKNGCGKNTDTDVDDGKTGKDVFLNDSIR